MNGAETQRTLFDLDDEGVPEVAPVPVPARVTVLVSVRMPVANAVGRVSTGRPGQKKPRASILVGVQRWLSTRVDGGITIKPFKERTAIDLAEQRIIVVADFDQSHCDSSDLLPITALLQRGARLIGISGSGDGDVGYLSFKQRIRGEGHTELLDKRRGFALICDLLRRRILEVRSSQ